MRKFHIIVIILFGIFLMPNFAMACGGTSKEKSSKEEVASPKKEHKSCCDNDSSNEDKGCKGNCGHSKCGCSSTCPFSSVSFIPEIIFKIDFVHFSLLEKVNFSYTTPSISDGFKSIWLIPKIS